MQIYSSTDEFQRIHLELWEAIARDEDMSTKLLKSRMIVQFHYRDPEARITVDSSDGEEMKIYAGECAAKPIVEMFMKSNVAHEFWLGKVSVPVAIMTGKIVSKGPVNRALALLPVIKPAFKLYPTIFQQHNDKAVV